MPNRLTVRALLVLGFYLLTTAGLSKADSLTGTEPVLPIPIEHGQDQGKSELGRRLFLDPRLSSDGSVSCAKCHLLAIGGADPLRKSIGVAGAVGVINAPTVFNAVFNLAQFWDGRSLSLEEQIDGPIHNPVEMGTDWPSIIARLELDPLYRSEFSEIYAEGMTAVTIRDAIATYERTLVTPNSTFDHWLRGDSEALSEAALKGYELFKSYGCIACHQGVNLGGNMYHKMGSLGDYFGDRGGELTDADLGRYKVTGDEREKHFFKVPSLRLATLTAPYFHDGSAATLDVAIRYMAKYQLGRTIPQPHVDLIKAFLSSVVGTHPELLP